MFQMQKFVPDRSAIQHLLHGRDGMVAREIYKRALKVQAGAVRQAHKRTGRLQLGAFAVVCLGKQLLHHIGGGITVNALGRKIVQNLAAGLALAQQLRGAVAGKRDIV